MANNGPFGFGVLGGDGGTNDTVYSDTFNRQMTRSELLQMHRVAKVSLQRIARLLDAIHTLKDPLALATTAERSLWEEFSHRDFQFSTAVEDREAFRKMSDQVESFGMRDALEDQYLELQSTLRHKAQSIERDLDKF